MRLPRRQTYKKWQNWGLDIARRVPDDVEPHLLACGEFCPVIKRLLSRQSYLLGVLFTRLNIPGNVLPYLGSKFLSSPRTRQHGRVRQAWFNRDLFKVSRWVVNEILRVDSSTIRRYSTTGRYHWIACLYVKAVVHTNSANLGSRTKHDICLDWRVFLACYVEYSEWPASAFAASYYVTEYDETWQRACYRNRLLLHNNHIILHNLITIFNMERPSFAYAGYQVNTLIS